MTVITDPDLLAQGVEVTITTATKKIALTIAGDLTSDGVTLKCLYSFLKEQWKNDAALIKFPFPLLPITDEQFELFNGWDFTDDTTRYLIRNGGWALKDSGGVSQEEWAGVITLGSLGATDQVYFQQVTSGSATNIQLQGVVNQAVKVYGDVSHGSFDYRGYLKLFAREYQKTYASAALTDIGVTTMTYQVYRFPLSNGSDLKITHADGTMTGAPYNNIKITWYAAPQGRSIGGVTRNFHVVINGNNATAEQIYEKVQYLLRQNADIDEGSGTKTGKTAADLLRFVGDTLYTLAQTEGGVYIDNFLAADTNRLVFADDIPTNRTFPYVAALTLNFGENLVADAGAIYRVFFTNDDVGDNTGRDYGTATAMIVYQTAGSGAPMSGLVSGSGSIQLSFDYDGNEQRGAASKGLDAPITVVAIGLNTAQFIKATGTIQKSIANVVSLVASLERNYQNP
jgi:hypothetical protein